MGGSELSLCNFKRDRAHSFVATNVGKIRPFLTEKKQSRDLSGAFSSSMVLSWTLGRHYQYQENEV